MDPVRSPKPSPRMRNELNSNSFDYDRQGLGSNHVNNNNNNNNNNQVSKFGHLNPTLTPQTSLPLPESYRVQPNQSFLAPPTFSPRERRHSTSSCDSSVSQTPRRRLSRNPSSRMSDFEDDKKDFITFGRVAKFVYKKVGVGVRKAVSMLFVSRPNKPNIVCEAEVMDQAAWICTDYVINRLSSRNLMSRKIGLTAPDWFRSGHVIDACSVLELSYPKIYSNVSRKLAMTMSSPKIVRTTITALLKVLFGESVTWGKIVSMFVVAGLFAEECSSQGHADYVKDVVDVVADFTNSHLLPWLVSQGGWESFPTPSNNLKSRLSKSRVLVLTVTTTAALATSAAFLDLW